MSTPDMNEVRRVDWIDSCSQNGWHPTDEALEKHGIGDCVSVGFVVKETDTEIFLAQSKDNAHDNLAEVIAIPKVCITGQAVLTATEGWSER